MGQVWGWGYGGDGQLGLGSRIRIVSSPQPIACVETSSYFGDRISLSRGGLVPDTLYKVPGTYVKAIACGGRHSAVVTGVPFIRAFICSVLWFLDFMQGLILWGLWILFHLFRKRDFSLYTCKKISYPFFCGLGH